VTTYAYRGFVFSKTSRGDPVFAMSLTTPGQPLRSVERPIPEPGPDQILIRVRACGVCRTDLHVVDGELPNPKPGIVPGHEVVGTVERFGAGVDKFAIGERVGVPWLGWTCSACRYCLTGRENQGLRIKLHRNYWHKPCFGQVYKT
jgi:propanol-preferring alcohol dehydrogenase